VHQSGGKKERFLGGRCGKRRTKENHRGTQRRMKKGAILRRVGSMDIGKGNAWKLANKPKKEAENCRGVSRSPGGRGGNMLNLT